MNLAPRSWQSPALRTACLILVLAAGSCRHQVRPEEREESFRSFLGDRVGDVELSGFLAQRTALLIAGALPETVEKTANGWDIRLGSAQGTPVQLGLGSAIALSADGYFLTAAHNLHRAPFAVAILRSGRVDFAEAKVVWSGTAEIPEEDFAIIKASLRPEGVFEWDDDADFEPGMDLASMSGPHGRCGGKLWESSRYSSTRTPCQVRSVIHDLPLLEGDSGGPVVGRDGRLVGMNVLQKGNLTASSRGQAIRPERRWILKVVSGTR
jgi:S1-C subfamily serine protease